MRHLEVKRMPFEFFRRLRSIWPRGRPAIGHAQNSAGTQTYRIFSFPESVAALNRCGFFVYEKETAGVGASYQVPGPSDLAVDVYGYPAPVSQHGARLALADAFQAERAGVAHSMPTASPISWIADIPRPAHAGEGAAHEAFEVFDMQNRRAVSLLSVFDYGPLLLKFRATFIPDSSEQARDLRAFYGAYPYP
jgi:hypothetical protein